MDFSFQGALATDDGVALITFTANGTSTVTLRSYGYAGGTQANAAVVAAGGFDPIVAIFDGSGALVTQADDGPDPVPADPVTGAQLDSNLSVVLPAGTYTLAVVQYDNVALGPTLADGFAESGIPAFTAAFGCSNGQFCDVDGFNRTSSWALDVLGVESASVPEPSLLVLSMIGVAALALSRR